MPNAQGNMLSIANTDSPGNTSNVGGFPKPQYRADAQTETSANSSYPRHPLMAINLFVHEMFQQFPSILGIASDTEEAVAPRPAQRPHSAPRTAVAHPPPPASLALCNPAPP